MSSNNESNSKGPSAEEILAWVDNSKAEFFCDQFNVAYAFVPFDIRDYKGLKLFYLDEVHRLVKRSMDHLLLKPLDELDAVWIASSAITGPLEKMFKNRFTVKVSTSLPTTNKLALFLAERCREWNIDVDSAATLITLAERSDRVPGCALGVLAVAAGKPGRRLTCEVVMKHRFFEDQA